MDLRQMRHVLALAEHRNYARAAQALHITQPALTRSIQGVESSLQAVLFDRGRRDVAPTAIGQMVLEHARTIEAAARDLERDVQLARGMEIGSLQIGVGSFAGPTFIAETLARFNQAYPGLRSKVILAPWRELPDRLRAREIELMVGDMSEIEALEDFQITLFSRRPYMPVVRAGHPLEDHGEIAVVDLDPFPVVGPTLLPPMEIAIRQYLGRLEHSVPNTTLQAITCDSLSVLKTILLHSDAVSLLTPFMVADELRGGKLVAFPELSTTANSRYGVAHLRGRTLSSPARVFCDLLAAWDAELVSQEAQWHKRRLLRRDPGR